MLLNNAKASMRKLKGLLIGAALLGLAGCAAPHAGNGQLELTSAQWELVKWSTQPMPPAGVHPIVLRFDQRGDEGRVSGHAGCNQFSAPYVLREGGEITIATPVATRMTCAPDTMEFEERLLDKLESVSAYKINGSTMELIAGDGHLLNFRARAKVTPEAVIRFIYVAPQQTACADAGTALCYQVKENKDDAWRLWSGGIAGFDFHPGTAYRLRILEERIGGPGTNASRAAAVDAGDVKWTLDLVVEQEITTVK